MITLLKTGKWYCADCNATFSPADPNEVACPGCGQKGEIQAVEKKPSDRRARPSVPHEPGTADTSRHEQAGSGTRKALKIVGVSLLGLVVLIATIQSLAATYAVFLARGLADVSYRLGYLFGSLFVLVFSVLGIMALVRSLKR